MLRIFLFRVSVLMVLCASQPALAGECGVLVTSSATFMPTLPPQMSPDTWFVDEEGRVRDLKTYSGHPLLINFWGTWCPPCIKEIPSLDRLSAEMEKRGIIVLTLAWEKTGGIDDVRAFLRKRGAQHLKPQTDPGGRVAQAFSISRFPSTVLVDQAGQLRGTFVGGVNWEKAQVLDTVVSCMEANAGDSG